MVINIAERKTRRFFRVAKQDLAYIYAIFESYEGITSFTTQVCNSSHPWRHLILSIAPDGMDQCQVILDSLKEKMHELDEEPSRC